MILQSEKISIGMAKHGMSKPPLTIKWKGVPMIRNHSVRASVKEIIQKSKNRDVIRVGIIGEPDTGKTTQAATIAHLCHVMAKEILNIDFLVKKYEKDAFVNIKETLAALRPANYILQFGDLSFLKSTYGMQKIEELQSAMTEIRHLPGGKDVKMILIYDYHYTKGLPPYLRQSDFKYFTGVGSSDKLNMDDIISPRFHNKMLQFKKLSDQAPSTEKFGFRIGLKDFFMYKYREPFIPLLFWNEDKARIVVSPTRFWIDPICSTCAKADDSFTTTIDLDNLVAKGFSNFSPRPFTAAVKLMLHARGINVYGKTVTQACRWLEKIMSKSHVDLEDLAVKLDLKVTKTKLYKPISDVISVPAPELAQKTEVLPEPEALPEELPEIEGGPSLLMDEQNG